MIQLQEVSHQFAVALINEDFRKAYSLLSQSQKAQLSPDKLKELYENMIQYFGGAAQKIEVVEILEEWPQKEKNDTGWVYIGVSATIYDRSFSEGISVIVAEENSHQVIRAIQWGRP
jgi:hypothetical protein